MIMMARPIRNTPFLYGKDAADFIEAANREINPEERQRNRLEVEKAYKRFWELNEYVK